MSITFWSDGAEAHHHMNLSNDNALALMRAAGLDKHSAFGTGEVSPDGLPAILHNIETVLAHPTMLRRYVREPIDTNLRVIWREQNSNVVRIGQGPHMLDMGADERYLRQKLSRLYILATAAMDSNAALKWG